MIERDKGSEKFQPSGPHEEVDWRINCRKPRCVYGKGSLCMYVNKSNEDLFMYIG